MKKFIIYFFLVSIIASCKKDKVCNLDVGGFSGSYKISSVRYKATPASAEVDYFTTLFSDPCERDNLYTFNANGTYSFTDAGIICVPPDTDSGPWTLAGNTLTVDGDPANVDQFSCSAFTISQAGVLVLGDKVTFVFTRQ